MVLPLLLEGLPLGGEPALAKLLRRNSTMQSSAGASIVPRDVRLEGERLRAAYLHIEEGAGDEA